MSASTKRIILILCSFLLIIGALVVLFRFVFPAYKEIQNLRGKLFAEKRVLSEQKNALQQIQKLSREYKGIRKIEKELSLILPLEPNLPECLNQYHEIAKGSGVEIQSLSLNKLGIEKPASTLTKGLGKIRFKLKILGFYNNVKKFIETLETNARISDIYSFKIEPTTIKGNLYSLNLEVDNYYQIK